MVSKKKQSFLKAYDKIFKLDPEVVNGVEKCPTHFSFEDGTFNINYTINGKEYKNEIEVSDLKKDNDLNALISSHIIVEEDLSEGLRMLGIRNEEEFETFSFKKFKKTLGEMLWVKYSEGDVVLDNLYLSGIVSTFSINERVKHWPAEEGDDNLIDFSLKEDRGLKQGRLSMCSQENLNHF